MKITRRFIERIVFLSLATITAGVMVYIPLSSYLPYKQKQDAILQAAIKRDNETLKGIEAELKSGVEVFDNYFAILDNDDFDVCAVYGGKYKDPVKIPLDTDEYSVKLPSQFSTYGGNVVISYLNKSCEVEVKLKKTVVTDLILKDNPYKVTYQKGEDFDPTGLKIAAKYNDGSEEVLDISELTIRGGSKLDSTVKSVSVHFTKDGNTKILILPIKVVNELNNGEVTSIDYVGKYSVEDGYPFNGGVELLARYAKTDNRVVLYPNQYSLEGADVVSSFGKPYELKAVLTSNKNIEVKIPVSVCKKIQGESAKINNGKIVSETEYFVEDGKYVKGNSITFAATDGRVTESDKTTGITVNFASSVSCVTKVKLRTSNPYFVNGIMNPIQLNHVMDLIVNGQVNKIDDSVIIKGTPLGEQLQVYNVYYEYDLGYVQLNKGDNSIEFSIHASPYGELTSWDEPPCSFNIDYVNFEFDNHKHELEHIEMKNSTCNETGIIEHYYCDICKQRYSDEECTNNITNITIDKVGHVYSEWTYDETNHTKRCTRDGCNETLTYKHELKLSYIDGKYYIQCKTCAYSKNVAKKKISIVIDELFTPSYGVELSSTPVKAVVDGVEIPLTTDQYTITNSNDPNNKNYLFGDNYITVILKYDTSIIVSKLFNIKTQYFTDIKYVDLQQVNSRIYWIFEFENIGYTSEQYRLFDGSNTFKHEEIEKTITTIKLRVDVTDFAKNQYWPHAQLTVGGTTTNYPAHKNGDIVISNNEWAKDKTIKAYNKTYKLTLSYNMASLVIS